MAFEVKDPQAAAQPSVPEGYSPVFEVAPEEDLLYSLSADGKRKFMHPTVRKGRFWRLRRAAAYGLLAAFFALPWVTIGGEPALQFDIAARHSHVLGGTYYPTDNLILVAFGFGIIVTVFFVGSTFGRLWCGFACPQTVYLEFVFRPIEAWLEGGPVNQKRLNAEPWSRRKAVIKAAKWTIWSAVALAMSATFVSYFTGARPLWLGLASDPLAWTTPLAVIVAVAGLIVFDFGWFRDQMCTIACPYGRLQAVLADTDTILVAYDGNRGDPKVRLTDRRPGVLAGDCIACKHCVSACPTGTDIRRGMQSECIGVAQCVDACEEVMKQQGKPIGLIKFTSETELAGGRRHLWRVRNIAYLGLMAVTWGLFAFFLLTRSDALVEILRGGREPYRLLPTGEVANQQRVRITNQIAETQQFTVEVVSPPGAKLVLADSPIPVDPDKVVAVNAVATVPREIFVDGQATIRYRVRSDKGFEQEIPFLLLGPYGNGGGAR